MILMKGKKSKCKVFFNNNCYIRLFVVIFIVDPLWSELAERYEFEPELFISPQYLAQLEEYFGDDPSVYDWDKVRVKRTANSGSKELNEYKYQP